jgi:hypothetical protein
MKQVNLSTRRLSTLALPLVLFACAQITLAAELPSAPSPQLSATLSGTITDRDGDSIAAARITLTLDPQPTAPARTAITTPDGRFTFANIPPGPFRLSIAATGFAPHQTSGVLQAGESRELPDITLSSASTTNIEVTASQVDIAEAQINEEEKQRVLAIIPNFYVSYESNPAPLAPKQKYELALRTLIDPVSFALNGVSAGIEQATNTYAWGQGFQGYAKRYAAGYGNILTDTLLTNAVLPVLFKQDPRYFYKGTGSIHSRVLYAAANSFICKGDNHHWQPNYSGIIGSLAASGLSNVYYPAPNRAGAALTFEGAAIGTGITAIQNLFQEFLVRKLTPHLPHSTPANP